MIDIALHKFRVKDHREGAKVAKGKSDLRFLRDLRASR